VYLFATKLGTDKCCGSSNDRRFGGRTVTQAMVNMYRCDTTTCCGCEHQQGHRVGATRNSANNIVASNQLRTTREQRHHKGMPIELIQLDGRRHVIVPAN